jgi:hypothetical protein
MLRRACDSIPSVANNGPNPALPSSEILKAIERSCEGSFIAPDQIQHGLNPGPKTYQASPYDPVADRIHGRIEQTVRQTGNT